MQRSLEKLLLWPSAAFLLTLAAVLSFKLLNGRIRTRGLLVDPATGQVSALRVQQLLVTLACAGAYAAELSDWPRSDRLPPPPDELLMLFAGSNAIVLLHQTFQSVLRAFSRSIRAEKDSPS